MAISSQALAQVYAARNVDRTGWLATALAVGALCTSTSLFASDTITVSEPGGVGVSQAAPVLVGTSNGALIGFSDVRSGTPRYRTQTLSLAGQPLGSSFPLAETFAPSDDMLDLGISANSNGTVVAIWRHNINDDRMLLRLDAMSGLPIGDPVLILDDESSLSYWFNATVHVRDDGTSLVLFATNTNLRGRLYDENFAPLGSSFVVGDNFDPGPMNVGLHEDGSFTIAWTGVTLSYFDRVCSQVFSSKGLAIGPVVDHTTEEIFVSGAPVVSVRPNGEALVAWTISQSGNTSWCQELSASGTAIGEPSLIGDSASFVAPASAIYVTSNDKWLIVAHHTSGDATVRMLDSDLQLLPDRLDFEGDGFSSTWLSGSESVFLGWHTDTPSIQRDIEGVIISSATMTASDPVQITDDVDGADQLDPKLATNASGRTIIAWEDERHGEAQVYMQLFNNMGEAVGLNKHVAGSGQWIVLPDCAMNANGQSLVTWQETINNERAILAQRYDIYGMEVGAPINTTDNSLEPSVEYAVAIFDDGSFIVAYQTRVDIPYPGLWEYDLYVRLFGSDGEPMAAAQKVNGSHSAELDHAPLDFVPHSDGSCFLVYEVQDFSGSGKHGGNYDKWIRMKSISADGYPTGVENWLFGTLDYVYFTGVTGDDDGFSIVWSHVYEGWVTVRHFSNSVDLLATDVVNGVLGEASNGKLTLSSDGSRVLTYNDEQWTGTAWESTYRYQMYDSSGDLTGDSGIFQDFGTTLSFWNPVEFGVAGDRLLGSYSGMSMTDQGFDIMLTTVGVEVCVQADFNCDGVVNGADLSWLLGHWGLDVGDLDGDGITDGADLTILLGAWSP